MRHSRPAQMESKPLDSAYCVCVRAFETVAEMHARAQQPDTSGFGGSRG
jgi:hypothetical protein